MQVKDQASKKHPVKASHRFVIVLALVSIVGFIGIVSETLFNYNLSFYVEALLMIIIGIGLVIEGKPLQLDKIKTEGLTPRNFTHLITVVIGTMAIIAGIFSIPTLRIEYQGFLAVKGIVSIIAIIIIIIQTWIIE
jgi:hypothetical protein